jgi:hypothetical protein
MGKNKMKYRVHRIDIKMHRDKDRFEQFLNGLEGEVISIVPNVSPSWTFGGMGARVHYFWVIEKAKQ